MNNLILDSIKKTGLVGYRFGRLVAVSETRADNGRLKWVCKCDCGNETNVYRSHLTSGLTTSCGCRNREVVSARNIANAKHGLWKSEEFAIWSGMLSRCHNPKDDRFQWYGARGVAVCQEWRDSFTAFYSHIGPRPSKRHSVDRIKNHLGYQPGNVRWATPVEQANNKTSNRRVEFRGALLTAPQIARMHGLKPDTVWRRIRAGKTGDALVAPSRNASHG